MERCAKERDRVYEERMEAGDAVRRAAFKDTPEWRSVRNGTMARLDSLLEELQTEFKDLQASYHRALEREKAERETAGPPEGGTGGSAMERQTHISAGKDRPTD
jgi:hypothetical protein